MWGYTGGLWWNLNISETCPNSTAAIPLLPKTVFSPSLLHTAKHIHTGLQQEKKMVLVNIELYNLFMKCTIGLACVMNQMGML